MNNTNTPTVDTLQAEVTALQAKLAAANAPKPVLNRLLSAAAQAKPSAKPGEMLDAVCDFGMAVGYNMDWFIEERAAICTKAGSVKVQIKATGNGSRKSSALNLVKAVKALTVNGKAATAESKVLAQVCKLLALFSEKWESVEASE